MLQLSYDCSYDHVILLGWNQYSSSTTVYFISSHAVIFLCVLKPLPFLKAEMKRVANVDPSVLKQHYEKKVHELEHEKRALQVGAGLVICYKWLDYILVVFLFLLSTNRKRLRNWGTILKICHLLLTKVLKSWKRIIFRS